MSRTELFVNAYCELALIKKMGDLLDGFGFDSSNSTLVGVSSDYSAIAWQILRHRLSFDGEVCSGFCVDVPYPDEQWTNDTSERILGAFRSGNLKKNIILVEAGVIRGSNYIALCDLLARHEEFDGHEIRSSTLFENIGSKFKSEFVCEYYDDEKYDLTFWWERFNRHWSSQVLASGRSYFAIGRNYA